MSDPFAQMARAVLYATGTDCVITTRGGDTVAAKAGIRHVTNIYGDQLQGTELTDQVTVLVDDVPPDDFASLQVDTGLHAGVYTRGRKLDGDGKVSVFGCIRSALLPLEVFLLLLENGVDCFSLEDASGCIALET